MTQLDPTAEDLELLVEVWEADRVLDYPRIRELLSQLSPDRLLASEECTILMLYAYLRLDDGPHAAALLKAAASVFTPERSDRNRIRFICASGEHAWRQGRLSDAEKLAGEVLDFAHRTGDGAFMLHGLSALGVTAAIRGDFVQSVRHLNRALPFRDSDSGRWRSGLHHNLGTSYRDLGFTAESQRHFEEAGRHPRPAQLEAITTVDRALLFHAIGDVGAAKELAHLGFAMSERIPLRSGMAEARLLLASLAALEHELERAREELMAVFQLLPVGDHLLRGQTYEEAAIIAALSGDMLSSAMAESEAEQIYRRLEALPRIANMKSRLAELAWPV